MRRAAVEDEAPLPVLQLAHPFRDDDCGEEVANKQIGDSTDLGHEALDPQQRGTSAPIARQEHPQER